MNTYEHYPSCTLNIELVQQLSITFIVEWGKLGERRMKTYEQLSNAIMNDRKSGESGTNGEGGRRRR